MLSFEETRDDARKFSCEMLKDAVDKGGNPYVDHLSFVANAVASYGPEYEAVGWAHDVIEDVEDVTVRTLRDREWPEKIVFAVDCITKRPGEPYFEYLARVKKSEIASRVKLADLRHNSDMSRLKTITIEDVRRTAHYIEVIEYLINH